jgi:pantoate--beta-alanine ligase
MLTVTAPAGLRREVGAWKSTGLRVGFVPTMGALHEGHLSLVRLARGAADRVVASVFVNPTQFDRPDDLARYPRTPERDAELLAGAGCDLLFLPPVEAIYPPGHVTRVEVAGPPAEGLEGEHRPGHFRGVATVVTLLFHLVEPDVAVFGEKDAQQLAVVRRLVGDLALPVEVLGGPTVREPDGLALSSRNVQLGREERQAATVLYRALVAGREAIASGERRAELVRRRMLEVLAGEPLAHVEYAEAVDARTFWPLDVLRGKLVLPLAVRIGGTRLIDNLQIDLNA